GLFIFFAALTLGAASLLVLSRNAVTSAMGMILALVGVAADFFLLDAYFLGVLQVLVYAGAVMVLFLFVIMLLDLRQSEERQIRILTIGTGALAVAAIAGILIRAVIAAKPLASSPGLAGETKALGRLLFTQYLLPFEVMSLLLLVGMVGVILLSKKETE
ncbi:MAG: NADH-quinone oxidoreductase subunit J, partial [Verrucomicrobiota bacterium]